MSTGDLNIPLKRLDPTVELPAYTHDGDAGMDLHAAEAVTLEPLARALVPCGFAIALPAGFGALILPRSGLSSRHGVTVVNAPGLIDSNYRGEIKVALVNLDPETPFTVNRGDRIAQMLVLPFPSIAFTEVEELDATDRGAAGFGSSGLASAES